MAASACEEKPSDGDNETSSDYECLVVRSELVCRLRKQPLLKCLVVLHVYLADYLLKLAIVLE